ncbi:MULTISPECIES: nucleotide exchange factor GrpE [unclassified Pseudodesulfovibrio]|uniref:nucleotide exchange factor GrpE n=1 Tax=unclassified Pseudodesulfovibrio TaxID=2661612 RepID=UPI000FEC0410|nr:MULTISPECIES: nucleotide exchange factor GrpE [unclassified Pseudodesulfovibrio]MCJ2162978.1 nucleotide exchange factor GrpE [Pseudodesulfovibrio sp. S3-i]RWU06976.1 nucleotide exchange factor GrpE [Pseudodesulfovibrio sp. S3]
MAKNKNEVPINGLYDDEGRIFTEEQAFETPDEAEAGETEAEVSLSQEELYALCRESVCPACDVHKEAEGIRLRALADSENVKKRLMRETEELKKYAGESILADLLPILDNLDLALAHTGGLSPECQNFVIGVDMTRKLFLGAVKGHGLEQVQAEVGTEFDPEIHEAVGTVEEQGLGDNLIAQVIQGGYRLKGRLIRPAKVMVNKV